MCSLCIFGNLLLLKWDTFSTPLALESDRLAHTAGIDKKELSCVIVIVDASD